MKQFFEELFAYNHHFNQKLSVIIRDNPEKISEKTVQLFSHLLNAHQIWNSRIETTPVAVGVWELRPVRDLRNIDEANYEQTTRILHTFDLNDTIGYANTRGQLFGNRVQDILFHVINHSTYHRGQIATEFKQQGLEPMVTDYIFYKR